MWPFDDKTSWKLWPPSLVHRNTKHNAFAWRRDGHHSAQQKGRPKAAPYPKEHYVGGKDVNRAANCAPNVNNPSR